MSKMSEISAEMDNQNIPEDKRNSLIDRVSEGMHAAEKKIDAVKPVKASKSVSNTKDDSGLDWRLKLAQRVRKFADTTRNVITLDGKTYVKVGAYQFLASELDIIPEFDFEPESTQTEVWCTCTLRHSDGSYLTRATMYADKTEEFLHDKDDFAVLGTVQSRAFVRAMKNVYGYIMELAGYQSIGLEEMGEVRKGK